MEEKYQKVYDGLVQLGYFKDKCEFPNKNK